ncbi:hypothetical protein Smic_46480 [Streptomyces microflavus]|uniref:Uncharacterized protein n=1 Tax=Streptomyces microflavus TaxID=1919 RepID=A0A7J0CUL0_STRMI|nr:hypothetical protein Smic_46480 [Streptomyces microflavus]
MVPLRDPQLQGDQVHPEHGLRHRVFDLEAGVHLQEVRPPLGGDEELHGPRPPVADRPSSRHGRIVQPGAQALVQTGCRGLLDDLLVAALERAVPGPERPHGVVRVGHDLHLDVPAPLHVRLREHLPVPEGGRGLGGGRQQLGRE